MLFFIERILLCVSSTLWFCVFVWELNSLLSANHIRIYLCTLRNVHFFFFSSSSHRLVLVVVVVVECYTQNPVMLKGNYFYIYKNCHFHHQLGEEEPSLGPFALRDTINGPSPSPFSLCLLRLVNQRVSDWTRAPVVAFASVLILTVDADVHVALGGGALGVPHVAHVASLVRAPNVVQHQAHSVPVRVRGDLSVQTLPLDLVVEVRVL